jgi:ABC-2 type transport system ATP-binding protein
VAAVIQVNELTKRYRDAVAVDGLSFTVEPGQVTGFLGHNGAGKTTTMRVLLGLCPPTSGEALVGGRRYAEIDRPLHEVGALLDAGDVHPGRSAVNHLRWLARSNGIAAARVAETLEQVGLAGVARKRVGGFSLGMRQRLGIAAALLGDPGVLVFDEPVNGLDPQGMRWIRELLRKLAAEGRTVLISSHLMSEMEMIADRLIVIGRGRLLADTTVGELITRDGSASLEDAYLRITEEA